MKKMKQLILLTLCVFTLFGMTACAGKDKQIMRRIRRQRIKTETTIATMRRTSQIKKETVFLMMR